MDRVSPPKTDGELSGTPAPCAACGEPLAGPLAPHVCAACGRPQPVAADGGRDHFAVLGTPRRFTQDRPALERRFYELSRALHPDRFSALGGEAQKDSLERMSLLNRAWNTLKQPDSLRDHLIALEGAEVPKSRTVQPPMELVEPWFDIQDLVTEDPEAALGRLPAFEAELNEHFTREDRRIGELEAEWDRAAAPDILSRLAQRIQARSYLRSMQREIERIRARFGKPGPTP